MTKTLGKEDTYKNNRFCVTCGTMDKLEEVTRFEEHPKLLCSNCITKVEY